MTVDVLRLGRESSPACWADLSLTGVMLIVPFEAGVDLQVGAMVNLGFTCEGIRIPMKGQVAWSVPDDTGKITKAGIQFESFTEDADSIESPLWDYLNRREAIRAGVTDDETVKVSVKGPMADCSGNLLDISTNGIRVILDGKVAEIACLQFNMGKQFSLAMKLSKDLPSISLTAMASNFELVGPISVLSFSFSEEEYGALEELNVISDFMVRRERSMRDSDF